VGHQTNIKAKLRALLTSEIVPVDAMTHDGLPTERSIEEQGKFKSLQSLCPFNDKHMLWS
jgi:hypothetical protein